MSKIRNVPYVWELGTLLGVVLYIARSLYFANSVPSIGDEGAYLVKGLWFAQGDYTPFQDYGFWTNKAPLAFLIPGYVQYWFGAGLREARYFAVFLSVLGLAGVWIASCRMAGKGWATIAVWVLALSDAHTGTYSLALSQGLVACMLAWMLVLTLGDNRPIWQLIAGTVLAVCVVMTRQNMLMVPPVLILYIFWQYGWRTGWLALFAGVVVFIGFHVWYWPNIMQLWAHWAPGAFSSFFEQFRYASLEAEVPEWTIEPVARYQSFANGMRDLFFILVGICAALTLWAPRRVWKTDGAFKSAIFLLVNFVLLFAMHTWASLFNTFCVQCFSSYQLFYSGTGIVLIVLVFSSGITVSKFRQASLIFVLLVGIVILGSAYYSQWGELLLEVPVFWRWNRFWSDGLIEPLWLKDVLTYSFGIARDVQERLAAGMGGLLIGLSFLLLIWMYWQIWARKYGASVTLTNALLIVFLTFGSIYPFLNGRRGSEWACGNLYLTYYTEAGKALDTMVLADDLVYWGGNGRQLALLLYLDEVQIFPPQIQAGGGTVRQGDVERMLKFGRFDDSLNRRWRDEADVLLVWDNRLDEEFLAYLEQSEHQSVSIPFGEWTRCEEPLFVFRREKK